MPELQHHEKRVGLHPAVFRKLGLQTHHFRLPATANHPRTARVRLTAAIEAGGKVVAVIGTPIDRAYPAENMQLQEQIYSEHLLISQFAPGSRVYPSNFPDRNKLMAALSDATAIIEAGDTSGTLHQAAECLRLERWLFIAKNVIDDPSLEWPKRFRHYQNVITLTSSADVLRAIGIQ